MSSAPPTASLALRPKPALLTGVESFVRQWWPVGLFSVLWLDLIRQLSYQWSTNEQYAYGWFVPLLALGLFVKKWPTRPRDRSQSGAALLKPIAALTEEPENPWALGIPIPWSKGLVIRWNFVVTTFVAFAALLLLPVRVVYEANQDWPLCSWLLASGVVAISLYAVFLIGGWPWVRHFAFPICFILVAVRWPSRLEHNLTQGLMRAVAGVTVHVLNWVDIIATQRGNLIELSTGAVGINAACSGIRSFQCTLMGALFLGELYLLGWRQRLWLLAGGAALSFGFNVVRTLLLTWYASDAGIEAVEKWHDPAGLSIFLASFASLWLLAWLFKRRIAAQALADEIADYGRPMNFKPKTVVPRPSLGVTPRPWVPGSQGQLVRSPAVSGQSAVASGQWSVVSSLWSRGPVVSVFRHPRLFLTAVGCWALCCILLCEAWYLAHEQADRPSQRWQASLPVENPTFETVPIPPRAVENLRSDTSVTGKWRDNDGSEWTVFFFHWKPKSIFSLIRARQHRPETCLPTVGFRQLFMSEPDYFQAGPWKLPFRKYIYEVNGQVLHVFFCLWQDGDTEQTGMPKLDVTDRLEWARKGRRKMGQQTLEIVVSGYGSLEKAEREVRRQLPRLVRVEPARAQALRALPGAS